LAQPQTESKVESEPTHGARNELIGIFQAASVLFAAIPFLVAIIRMMRVSEGDDSVLVTLLQHADFVRLFIATFIDLLPMSMAFLAWYALYSLNRPTSLLSKEPWRSWSVQTAPLLLVLSICFMTPIGAASMIGMVVVIFIAERKTGIRQLRKPPFASLAIGFCVLLIFSSNPPIPLEQISILNGTPDLVYVLSEGDRFTKVLTSEKKRVAIVLTDEITSRIPCNNIEQKRLIISYLSGTSTVQQKC